MYPWRNDTTYNEFDSTEESTISDSDTDSNPRPSTSMAPDAPNSTTTETKKKLKTSTPYSGKREDLRKFLQEIKIYLLANGEHYPTNLDKILFVLSYMSDGDANSWKEEYFETAEQKAAQDNTAPVWPGAATGKGRTGAGPARPWPYPYLEIHFIKYKKKNIIDIS